MNILANMLDQVRLKGMPLFHYELGRPWSVALPQFSDAVFHNLSRGSADLVLEDGPALRMAAGDWRRASTVVHGHNISSRGFRPQSQPGR
jgi:Cupin